MRRLNRTQIATAYCCLSLLFLGCGENSPVIDGDGDNPSHNWSNHTPFQGDYFADLLPITNRYEAEPTILGNLQLDEASGISPSVKNEGMFWTHEDSGNTNFIFLINSNAEIVCRYRVTGTNNIDWEDIETVIDPETGKSYVYISDTGDNAQRRAVSAVYRVEEPVYTAADFGQTIDLDRSMIQRYTFSYPDGSKDVESMFVDPSTKDIYFVTKRDVLSRIYIMPFPYQEGAGNQTYFVGEFGFREASAASLNLQADKLIVRNRQNLFYWERNTNEAIWEMMSRTPQRLPYQGEVQGEAVCFDKYDNYYTVSERAGLPQYPPLYKYTRKQ
ncbi:hypothetical protein M8998_12820 [Sphingobacterium sp. lm-10]|uniref:hypothetical protein n=1 Tax=Sphingobacterium sp. lm-10 TaxID=2944904 RepID=UPI002021443A|nr:hypothetical protein [Sphingobacterium sp. lm-10]MCL7988825.1 hypothetical protein [Sphingobacterium sp. lm-10]